MTATWIFKALDRDGLGDLRLALRPDHRLSLRRHDPVCRCISGGPLMDDAADRMIGTLLMFEARHRADVVAFMADDPYVKAGLFAHTEIVRWDWTLKLDEG